jgi:outer membrane protein TolC
MKRSGFPIRPAHPQPVKGLATAALMALVASACTIVPEAILPEAHVERAIADQRAVFDGQEPLNGPLTLHEATARALKYNFDHRLTMMEEVLQKQQLDLATFNMLPRLAASAGYNVRNNESASSSLSILTRRQSLEPSTSQDQERWSGDLTFTWNLLDFGVSYFQAKQQADRALIAYERRRRVINNMVKEVRSAFWRAATAERLLPKIDPVLADTEKALKASRHIESEMLQPLMQNLEYRKNLLQVLSQLRKLRSDLSVAKAQLSALINVPPGTPFTISLPEEEILPPAVIPTPLRDLESFGLASRPELREEAYQERVDRNGVYKEIVKMLPGVSLLSSLNYDSNSYLVNNAWGEAGFRVTWNLIGLISAPKALSVANAQVEVSKTRRLALSIAVMTQINISYQQYLRAIENYETALEVSKVEDRILKAVDDAGDLQAQSDFERIRHAGSAIAAQLERDRSLAELQSSLANLYISIGLDPLPVAETGADLPALTTAVKAAFENLDSGKLPELRIDTEAKTKTATFEARPTEATPSGAAPSPEPKSEPLS